MGVYVGVGGVSGFMLLVGFGLLSVDSVLGGFVGCFWCPFGSVPVEDVHLFVVLFVGPSELVVLGGRVLVALVVALCM